MTDRELLQQALDALINAKGYIFHNVLDDKANRYDTAIEALRARLAQPEPEPVAWYYAGSDVEWHSIALDADLDDAQKANCTPLYTAPPQREWQGLTDGQKKMAYALYGTMTAEGFVKSLETKLKENNT